MRTSIFFLLILLNNTSPANASTFEFIDKAINYFSRASSLVDIYNAPVDTYGLTGNFGCGSWSLSVGTGGGGSCSPSGLLILGPDQDEDFVPLSTSWSLLSKFESPINVSFKWNFMTRDPGGAFYDPLLVSSPVKRKLSSDQGSYSQRGNYLTTLLPRQTFTVGIDSFDGILGAAEANIYSFVFSERSYLAQKFIEELVLDSIVSLIDFSRVPIFSPFEIVSSIGGSSCAACDVRRAISRGEEIARLESYEQLKEQVSEQCSAAGNSPQACSNFLNGAYKDFGVVFPGAGLTPSGLIILRENSPAYIGFEVQTPVFEEGDLVIPFLVENAGDGDALTIWRDGDLLWTTLGLELESGRLYFAQISAALLSDFQGNLSFILMSAGDSQAAIVLPDISITSLTFVPAPVPEVKRVHLFLLGCAFLLLFAKRNSRTKEAQVY